MELQEEKRADVTIVYLHQRIDSSVAKDFEAALLGVIDRGIKNLVIDFSKLEYISSAGLRVILMGAKKIKTQSGHLALTSMRPAISEVFAISGFANVLAIHSTLDDGIKAVS